MRRFLAFALVLLAGPALAGSIRPAAAATDPTTEDPYIKYFMRDINAQTCASVNLPKSCTDAQAKDAAVASTTCAALSLPANCTSADKQAAFVAAGRVLPVIYTTNQAGIQDYGSVIWAQTVHAWIAQGKALKVSKQLSEAYLALDPATQADIDTRAGIQ